MDNQGDRKERFHSIALKTKSIEGAKAYWSGILEMKVLEESATSIRMGYHESQVALEFLEKDGSEVEHKEAMGRVAFACDDVTPIYNLIKQRKEHLETDILVLPTEGKADVRVVILKDRDDYEICYVEDVAFY